MDLVEAHGLLARLPLPERPELPCSGAFADPRLDGFAATATALASLSGMLEDAAEPDDLMAGVEHGASLVNAEVVALADVQREANRVVQVVLAWGDQQTAERRERGPAARKR